MTYIAHIDDVDYLSKQIDMDLKLFRLIVLIVDINNLFASNPSSTVSQGYGERGKDGMIQCCGENFKSDGEL